MFIYGLVVFRTFFNLSLNKVGKTTRLYTHKYILRVYFYLYVDHFLKVFIDFSPSSQSYGFSTSHVWMCELDHKESRALKNWCFWTVVLEKTLESPLDCKEIQPVNRKGNQSWIFIERTDTEAETPIF